MKGLRKFLSGILVSSGFLLTDCGAIFATEKGKATQQQSVKNLTVESDNKSLKDNIDSVSVSNLLKGERKFSLYCRNFDRLLNFFDDLDQILFDLGDGIFSNKESSNALNSLAINSQKSSSDVKFKENNTNSSGSALKNDNRKVGFGDWVNLDKSNAGKYEKFEQDVDGGGKYLCENYVSKDGKTRMERRVFYKSSSSSKV